MGLFSCLKNDDNQTDKIAGEKAMVWIKSQVMDESGKLIFTPDDIDGVYVYGVDDKQIAHNLCAGIIDADFEGDSYKHILPAKKGEVVISATNQEGHYYTLDFKVEGIPAFQLNMMHPQAIENENMGRPTPERYAYYECTNAQCRRTFTTLPFRGLCNRCGSHVEAKYSGLL